MITQVLKYGSLVKAGVPIEVHIDFMILRTDILSSRNKTDGLDSSYADTATKSVRGFSLLSEKEY